MSVEENKALVRRAFAAANAGDIDASVAATAPDARLNGQPFGREGDRERTRRLLAAFPDVHYGLHDLIAENEISPWTCLPLRFPVSLSNPRRGQRDCGAGRRPEYAGRSQR